MGETCAKLTPWVVFSFFIIIWIAGIILPFLPHILSDIQPQQNPYLGLSSAVIGAGPFLLYVLYQEYVKSPRFVITKKENEQGIPGIYFDKLIVEQGNNIYPVIEVLTTLKNVGKSSVKDASARVNLTPKGSSNGHIGFDSRWTGDLYGSSTSLHPGREREMVLFQAIPTEECLKELDFTFDDEEIQLCKENISTLNFGTEDSPDSITHASTELYLERPLNPDAEQHVYEAEDYDKEARRRFISQTISCSESFEVSIQIVSSDWSGSIEVPDIQFDDTLLQGRWYNPEQKYEPLYDELEKIGWSKPDN